jgi:hypothetical protein
MGQEGKIFLRKERRRGAEGWKRKQETIDKGFEKIKYTHKVIIE